MACQRQLWISLDLSREQTVEDEIEARFDEQVGGHTEAFVVTVARARRSPVRLSTQMFCPTCGGAWDVTGSRTGGVAFRCVRRPDLNIDCVAAHEAREEEE